MTTVSQPLTAPARTRSGNATWIVVVVCGVIAAMHIWKLPSALTDVQAVFETVPLDTTPSHADWQRASRRWKKQLEERRRGLERLESELTGCIGCGCLSMKACALLNPDDALAATGAGPRRLEDDENRHAASSEQ